MRRCYGEPRDIKDRRVVAEDKIRVVLGSGTREISLNVEVAYNSVATAAKKIVQSTLI